jgi:flagellar secretion chaperone FliS
VWNFITAGGNQTMTGNNPYQAYTEGSVLSGHPLRLVVALYEGALDGTRQAVTCLQARDIWGRGRAINKVIAILSELLASLDEKKGGEIATNLKRLYFYMQRRLIEAHARQAAPPLLEVEKLLETILESWREAASKVSVEDLSSLDAGLPGSQRREAHSPAASHPASAALPSAAQTAEPEPYADYLGHDAETPASPVFSF